MTKRHEIGQAVLLLGGDDGDGVTVGRWLEAGMADPGDALAGGLAGFAPALEWTQGPAVHEGP